MRNEEKKTEKGIFLRLDDELREKTHRLAAQQGLRAAQWMRKLIEMAPEDDQRRDELEDLAADLSDADLFDELADAVSDEELAGKAKAAAKEARARVQREMRRLSAP